MATMQNPLSKRALISKANRKIVLTVSFAVFLTIFSLVSTKAIVNQISYQNRVIAAKKIARDTLSADLAARDSLVASYRTFIQPPTNIIGGNTKGSDLRDGDNAKIILDALPSQYDFPALATSLEKLILSQGVTIGTIGGSDDEVAQSKQVQNSKPQPVIMSFELSVSGSYASIQGFTGTLERSIRPIKIKKMDISGTDGVMRATISAETYYQPKKDLTIKTEVVN